MNAQETIELTLPITPDSEPKLNYDPAHLRDFLVCARQFLSPSDLFYFKNLRQALVETTGVDEEFNEFYDLLNRVLNRPVSNRGIHIIAGDGRDLISSCSIVELVETGLYLGSVHSDRVLEANEGSFYHGLDDPDSMYNDLLGFYLAFAAIRLGAIIFDCREHVERLLQLTECPITPVSS